MSSKSNSELSKQPRHSVLLPVKTPQETRSLAKVIAAYLTPGLFVGLSGELGAGKTELAKSIASELGVDDEVSSPTYVVEFQYELSGGLQGSILSHWDLYRVNNEEFCRELASSKLSKDYIGLVEWPEKVRGVKDLLDLQILITFCGLNQEGSDSQSSTCRNIEVIIPDNSDIGAQARVRLIDDLKRQKHGNNV
jgi:tRNA threonylcarbamoyladenosine biosynthesis protein TsaE